MLRSFFQSTKIILILAFILCGFYPALIWVIGSIAFPDKANGDIIYVWDKPVGSRLIGQSFNRPEYFHGRPSAAGPNGYDASNSSGSNLGPTNKKLSDRLVSDIEKLLKENPNLSKGEVPANLVTASASGLDPHISPQSANVQIARVAEARKLDPKRVEDLVQRHTEGPQFGLFGEPVINVLTLNLALDTLIPVHNSQISSMTTEK